MAGIPKSILARTSRLLLSGAKIAGQEVAGRLAASLSDKPLTKNLATKIRQTQELVQTLGQLKGAAMKAGQMLSLEFSDLLPPEVVDVLRQLHDSSTFMPFAQVQGILLRELGAERAAQLQDLSPEPIAAASIGQVHKAKLDGRTVVVKVQFPGVSDTIGADLAVLRRAVSAFLQLQGKKIQLDDVFAELSRMLVQETDYLLEAEHAAIYRNLLGGSGYVVPEIFKGWSTRTVLTMSYEGGSRLGDWLKATPGPKAVDDLGKLVIELLIREFFVGGLVQTDPNYGNFLYRPSQTQLVLLDFGAVNAYPVAFRREVLGLLVAAAVRDEKAMLQATYSLGLLDPREGPATQTLFLDMMALIGSMFDPARQPFSFADSSFLQEIREAAVRFMQSVKVSAPPRQVMFLNRKLGGMFHLLKDAGASLDLAAYLNEVKALELTDRV